MGPAEAELIWELLQRIVLFFLFLSGIHREREPYVPSYNWDLENDCQILKEAKEETGSSTTDDQGATKPVLDFLSPNIFHVGEKCISIYQGPTL